MVGAVRKAMGREGFASGVLWSEDGGGGGRNRGAAASGGSLLSGGGARHGRGEGRGNWATCGGRRVTSRGPGPDRRGIARASRQRPGRDACGWRGVSAQWGVAESLTSGPDWQWEWASGEGRVGRPGKK
jgi:hypothetical protein